MSSMFLKKFSCIEFSSGRIISIIIDSKKFDEIEFCRYNFAIDYGEVL